MSKQLRILMISHHRRHKALGRPHAMGKHLVELGHQVTLIVIAEERRLGITEDDWDGVRIIETPDLLWGRLRSGWDPWDLLNRIAFLSKDRGPYDLVHCFETRPATIYPAFYYSRRYRTPLLTDWNDWFGRGGLIEVLRPRWYPPLLGKVETYYEEAFRSSAQGLTVISSALASRAQALGVSQESICLIPGGTQPERFLPRTQEDCRERVRLFQSGPIIGFSSTDTHLDLDIVMAALAIVAERFPSVRLIVTGKAGHHVLDLAETHGVEKNIHLTGFVPFDDLPWYLGCADVFVLPFPATPYNIGRWPNKIGEYMSLGRPTVSNATGDIRTLFEARKVGLLADWEARDFADKILYLLENPDIARRIGNTARETAVKEYDWKILIRKLEDFYTRVVGVGV